MILATADLAALSRLLDEAMELDDAQAEAWLAALPADDAHLRERLRDMLVARRERRDTGFLADGPALPPGDGTLARCGDVVGPWRLIRELGRGGMGEVWLAERADGSWRRQVALKLPRLAWGSGLAERMARERDIGALLEHPNIARLYDAGVDAQGRPWLAFECIAGQALDAWCDAHAPTLAARLALFVQVARAVAYAHGRLVVHRDLKPSNVLVGADGQAHLLDFGIAKLLDDEAPGARALTLERGRVLTLEYASPEQLEGGTITVASDVYALGVLLHELVTGRLPFESHYRGAAALEQAMRRDEPPPASSRVADRRAARALRGGLDAIVAKALRREPARRYATADALAQDVERHLVGDAVLARPDGRGQRAWRFLRRRWRGVASVVAIGGALAVGAAVAGLQAQRAAQAAERERAVRAFVVEMFRAGRPGAASGAQPVSSAEGVVENGAALIQARFAGAPDVQAELYGVVGDVFADMGAYHLAASYATRQVDTLANLGATRAARARALLALAQSLHDDGNDADAAARVATALAFAGDDAALAVALLVLRARIEMDGGDFEAAARTLADIELHARHVTDLPAGSRAWIVACRARLLGVQNRLDEAGPLLDQAIAIALGGEGPQSRTAIEIRLGAAMRFAQTAHAELARRHLDAAVAALHRLGGAHEVRAAMAGAEFAHLFYEGGSNGTAGEAVAQLRRSREQLVAARTAYPAWFPAQVDFWTGSVKAFSGDVAGGLQAMETSWPTLSATPDAAHDRVFQLRAIGAAWMNAGRHDLADATLRDALKLHARAPGFQHPYEAVDHSLVARNLMMAGRYDDAVQVLRVAPHFKPMRGDGWDGERFNKWMAWGEAEVRLAEGRTDEALALLAAAAPAPGSQPDDVDAYDSAFGEARCRAGQPARGLPVLEAALARELSYGDDVAAPWTARLQAVAGRCALAAGDRASARRHADLARAAFTTQPDVAPYFKAPYEALVAQLRGR